MKYLSLSLLVFFITACSTTRHPAAIAPAPGQLSADGKLWSSLFQQHAAEYKALCLQAYNIARLRVDEALLQSSSRPTAIVTDIDETFLDNSPYAVHQALQGKDYEAGSWYEWTSKGIADTMPGSWSFFQYAASRGITIFYITNRDEKDKAGTLSNLQRYGFPFADNQHLVVRQTTSSKEERRKQVAASYDIILLLGDNLADFSALFDKKTAAERDTNVKLSAAEFGKRFIVLPNADYGGWEDAIYDNNHNWTPAQKDSIIRSKVKGY